MARASREIFKSNDPVNDNGIVVPEGLGWRKYANRVVIHPTSVEESKNWFPQRFIKLQALNWG